MQAGHIQIVLTELFRLQAKNKALLEENAALREENGALRSEEAARAAISAVTDTIEDRYAAQAAELKAEYELKLSALTKQIADLQKTLQERNAEISELTDKASAACVLLQAKMAELNGVRREKDALSSQVRVLRSSLEDRAAASKPLSAVLGSGMPAHGAGHEASKPPSAVLRSYKSAHGAGHEASKPLSAVARSYIPAHGAGHEACPPPPPGNPPPPPPGNPPPPPSTPYPGIPARHAHVAMGVAASDCAAFGYWSTPSS